MKLNKTVINKNLITAIAILLLGFVLTITTTLYYVNEIKTKVQKDFTDDCNEITNKVNDKLYEHSLILLSSRAFFVASDEITRLDWHNYNDIQIKNNLLKGVQGLGFTKIIKPNELQSHINLVRLEGFPDYTIKPEGDRPIYTSIIYLEPFNTRNQRAFGYDMYSEQVRREAMTLARDLNITTISRKVTLVVETDEDKQYGFLMYTPVYNNEESTNNIEERRNAIIGWVFSPFRINDLMKGLLDSIYLINKDKIQIQIYDSTSTNSNNLLFDNQNIAKFNQNSKNENVIQKSISFNNHSWTLVFNNTNSSNILLNRVVLLIFLGGLCMSFLFFSLFLIASNTQYKAEKIADNLTIKLKEKNLELIEINNKLIISKNITEENEHFLKDFINAIPDLVWIKDVNGVYLNCNKRFEAFFGTNEANILGKTDFDFVNKELAEFFRANDKIAMDKGQPTINEEVITFANDGHQEYIETIKTPIYHKDGSILGILGIGRNITERKRNEEEIEQKNQELTENNNAKDKLFSIVAHDLKSPFNGFLGLTKMMVENADLFSPDEKTDMFIAMKKSAENMYSLLENLLEWSRIQRGIISHNPEEVMLRYVVETNYDILRNTANQKQIKLSINIPYDFEIIADIPSLNTIFRNLISNAIKFTKIGGEIEVGIIEKENKNEVQNTTIYVKDSGIGMTNEMINKLFKLDQDVSRRGTEGEASTGLGLLLCNDFVKKHNGKIWVESEEGKGTTFFFTLG